MHNFEYTDILYNDHELKTMFDSPDEVVRNCSFTEIVRISQILKLTGIVNILYFSLRSVYTGKIHIDKHPKAMSSAEFALNIPITNHGSIYMNWFKRIEGTNADCPVFDFPGGIGPGPLLDNDNSILIDTAIINSAMFVKINDWHNIENRSKHNMEQLISIRFNRLITVDRVKSLLAQSF
jgi:hypothetical protein